MPSRTCISPPRIIIAEDLFFGQFSKRIYLLLPIFFSYISFARPSLPDEISKISSIISALVDFEIRFISVFFTLFNTTIPALPSISAASSETAFWHRTISAPLSTMASIILLNWPDSSFLKPLIWEGSEMVNFASALAFLRSIETFKRDILPFLILFGMSSLRPVLSTTTPSKNCVFISPLPTSATIVTSSGSIGFSSLILLTEFTTISARLPYCLSDEEATFNKNSSFNSSSMAISPKISLTLAIDFA